MGIILNTSIRKHTHKKMLSEHINVRIEHYITELSMKNKCTDDATQN